MRANHICGEDDNKMVLWRPYWIFLQIIKWMHEV